MIELKKDSKIAIVGASNNPDKYGHKILRYLVDRGFEVFPVNLKEPEIYGLKAYATLKDLPSVPDIIDFVVPPAITLGVLDEVKNLGWDNTWFQPGSFDDAVIQRAKELNLHFVDNDCIMAAADRLK